MKTHRKDAGFSLAALIFFATAASILIAAAYPAYQMQAKRETELELLFRGEEYIRAIQKYQRKFGIYPTSVDQLIETNGLRFLRRAYKDPITGEDFRLLTINPDGTVSGSVLFGQRGANAPLFGNTQPFQQGNPGFGQQPAQPAPGSQGGGGVRQPAPQSGGFQQMPQQNFQGFAASPQASGTMGPGGSSSTPGPFGFGQVQQAAPPQQGPAGGPRGGSIPGQRGSAAGFPPGFAPIGTNPGTPFAMGGMIGVASNSEEASIMVYNTRQKYNEWEFVAILNPQAQGQQPGQPGQPLQPGQAGPPGLPGSPGLPGQPGGQRMTAPFGMPSGSPFGPTTPFGQPGTPFGAAPAGQPIQQPFGSAPGTLPNPPATPPNQPVRR